MTSFELLVLSTLRSLLMHAALMEKRYGETTGAEGLCRSADALDEIVEKERGDG